MKDLKHINSLADLLRIVVRDMKMVKDDPLYHLNVEVWHEPINPTSGACAVCIAGAVMAGEMGVLRQKDMEPYDFDTKTCGLLLVIDTLRTGWTDSVALRLQEILDEAPSIEAVGLLLQGLSSDKVHSGDLATWETIAERAEEMRI